MREVFRHLNGDLHREAIPFLITDSIYFEVCSRVRNPLDQIFIPLRRITLDDL